MSSQLFYTIDNSNVEGDIEKKIIWADDFIEIFSYQPSTQRTHTFRISCALLSCMIQHFHYDVNLLWKLLADSVKYYDDRIIFSTQHIIYFPIFKDSLGREALRIYEVSEYHLSIISYISHLLLWMICYSHGDCLTTVIVGS